MISGSRTLMRSMVVSMVSVSVVVKSVLQVSPVSSVQPLLLDFRVMSPLPSSPMTKKQNTNMISN